MGFQFRRKKLLTRPVLKLLVDTPVHVKIERPMYVGKDLERNRKEGDKKKEPATILDVINLEDGSEMQVIASAVIKSVLMDEYKDHAYVGKCFEFTKRGKAPGKEYWPVEVSEIDDPLPPPAVEANGTATSESASASSSAHAPAAESGSRHRRAS